MRVSGQPHELGVLCKGLAAAGGQPGGGAEARGKSGCCAPQQGSGKTAEMSCVQGMQVAGAVAAAVTHKGFYQACVKAFAMVKGTKAHALLPCGVCCH